MHDLATPSIRQQTLVSAPRRLATVETPPGSPAMRQRAVLTRVSWSPTAALEFDEWIEHGRRIGRIGRSIGWWIGDWLRYGSARYGEKYAHAAKITGYDVQTLMNMVWVASRIEISRRREALSWSHHVEVVRLDLLTQERLLDLAEAERLSVRDLREMIRGERRGKPRPDTALEPGIERCEQRQVDDPEAIVCPHCGYRIVLAHA